MVKNRSLLILAAVFVVLPAALSLITFYTDWLFFRETGYTQVFTTALTAKIGAGLASGLFMFAFTMVNLHFANRASFPLTPRGVFFEGGNVYRLQRDEMAQMAKPLSILAALVLSLLAGRWGALQWQNLLLFANGVTVGTSDPIMGKDLGFYLFSLPLLEHVKGFAAFTVLVTGVMVGAVYFFRGGIALSERGADVDGAVRRHLAILLGIFSLTLAAGFYLEAVQLLLAGGNSFHGAGYVDVNARLPLYRVLALGTPLAGAVVAFGIWKGAWRPALIPPIIVAAVYGIGIAGYPVLLQKFKVAPNELALETPYIANSIQFTRLGYDLDKIKTVPFDVELNLSAADIAQNDATIRNIRLWDHGPLLKTYSQLQQIRTYYKFFDVDNDRYLVNGQYTQVMLSPRELSYNDLPSRNWINERLIFTHGNGLAVGPVSRISKEGLPEFFIKDIPAVSLADIRVTRPEIYYGELSNDYVIVGTRVPEFSYPTATGNINTAYGGKGGVALDSMLRKALFAVRFKTEKILLSSDITDQSRILYYRTVGERVKTVAPFIRFDGDPYLVVADNGTLKWIIDGYTHSSRLPYSKPLRGGINYMRNSVKAVIDAYDGTLDFYISDPDDVMIKVYARIFPGLFKPLSVMPADLRGHIRYPHQFLQVQAAMFATYHMTDPKVFYNRENLWEIPVLGEAPMEPYYTVMKLPGETREEYILLLPFTPSKRDNLAAWLTARCDGENYGKLLAYTFPRDRLIYGPKQIDARINQDSHISQQLTLWSQRGSQVIRGSMLVIPIEQSLLYVQPLFLAAADKAGLPELRRVIVAYGDEVVMEESLELALQRIFGGKRAPVAGVAAAPEDGKSSTGDLAREAMSIFERATNLQRQGDWAGYGEELRKLQQVLKQLAR
ncbi:MULTISPECIES: UPF0182 family protein [Geobacter]|uniref:UPF0182 protein SE37_03490 n=2 Tax=Geobacter TaxID=28231 RepID=A0A0C1QU25_9BACT|nr:MULTISPECIES: UPF0182 family protein [Geobacter]ANA39924.1 hypothetical protein A2G06_05785 [Geobacter anodireducens]KIE41756.1 hypothetical protein SE37_03490 [Geobacter soli]MBE2887886.1 UPF0182 family protein [Geobacter anodireducens]HMN03825.1 UPF0182 family protein [Geobacter anodireducens]